MRRKTYRLPDHSLTFRPISFVGIIEDDKTAGERATYLLSSAANGKTDNLGASYYYSVRFTIRRMIRFITIGAPYLHSTQFVLLSKTIQH